MSEEPKIIELETNPGLEELQKLVGGYVQIVPSFLSYNGRKCLALCDEEGRFKKKLINHRATEAWGTGDFLVGDVVILYGRLK